jgi:[ribosomal protein S5]-alanine N-acetyltransferase
MKFNIETTRLILRDFSYDDIDDFFEMDSDPEVHKYLGQKPIQSKEETIKSIEFVQQQYINNNIGRWTIRDKKTNAYIGWAGLKFITSPINGYKNFYDIGYRLSKKQWGKGFATEAAKAALEYGFDVMRLTEIHGTAHVENIASQTILQKIGLEYVNQFLYEGELMCNWYTIKK